MFRMDEDKSHALTLERFQALLWRFGFIVGGEKEAVQIMKRFDPRPISDSLCELGLVFLALS